MKNQTAQLAVNNRTAFAAGTILGLLGIAASLITDLALNGRVSWSIFPLASVLYVWLSCAPLVVFKKHGVTAAMLAASILLFPFLYILSLHSGNWFFSLGAPCAAAGLAFAWPVRFIWGSRLGIWNKLAITAVALGAVDLGIDAVLYWSGAASRFPSTGESLTLIALLLAAAILFTVGRLRSKNAQVPNCAQAEL